MWKKGAMNGNKTNKGQGFDWNPQNINRKWRPKKGISFINSELEKEWHSPATKQDILDACLYIMNLSTTELEKLKNKKNLPILIKIIVKSISDKKQDFYILEKLLDRAIWKPKQDMGFTDSKWNDLSLADILTWKKKDE